jgi:hypothetical protein
MKPIVYFDLEETVINNWFDCNLVNVHKVRSFIKHNNIEEIRIFSFAINNQADLDHFDKIMRSWLEQMFNIKIGHVIIEQEVTKTIVDKYRVDFAEVHSILNKQFCFIEYATQNHSNEHVVLLDDQVSNLTIHNKDLNLKIDLINVNSDIKEVIL